jgi:hypothetical protein
MNTDTFLYENQEVKLTGRVARKQLENKYNNNQTVKQLVEITPIDEGLDWTKFVSESDLYTITHD